MSATFVASPHHYYITPTLEDVLSQLHGAKCFTILDARSGYWNVPLDKESALLTTFNTPFGRFCYNRLPMGLKCAQDVFQREIDNKFGSIPGVFAIANDLVIAGFKADGSDHDKSLRLVLERARETGARFNEEKMVARCKQIPFFGHLIGEDGVTPDPKKVAAIRNMAPPTDAKSLQVFLGMVNYLNRFSPCLAGLTKTLRDLCRVDAEFSWGPEHQKAFDRVKQEICATHSLPYYDPRQPLTPQVDASGHGLGAALVQERGPVAFASKALTDAEGRYSNIEREMLGILYGLEKFHHYVFGRPVKVQTDHKPLVAIMAKSLAAAPPRLARMMLRIQHYNVTLEYVPGKQIPLADALSRISPQPGSAVPGLELTVHEIHSHLNASAMRLEEIKEETAKDPKLSLLREFISTGWPELRSECPSHLHGYWNFRDQLGMENGIIIKGTQIVIPRVLRPAALEKLHYAHQGMEKCRLRARGSVFWDGILQDIEHVVRGCAACQRHQASLPKEPILNHPIPPRPWHTVAMDLFTWEQNTYLLVADMYSRFPIVRRLTSLTADSIIRHLRAIFDEHGIPDKVVSDNGPQFSATSFAQFAKLYGFRHTTSSPYYPQSNGLIERQVQVVKLNAKTPSPSELLTGRAFKATLPVRAAPTQVLPEEPPLLRKPDPSCGRPLPPLSQDQHVRVQDPITKKWAPCQVVTTAPEPRSYIVRTNNNTVRRNRHHLRPTIERFDTPVQETDSDEAAQSSDCDQAGPMVPGNETAKDPTVSIPAAPASLRRSARKIQAPERLIENT